MAPCKQPERLRTMCVQTSSNYILNSVMTAYHLPQYPKAIFFQRLFHLIDKNIPVMMRSEMFHCILKLMPKGCNHIDICLNLMYLLITPQTKELDLSDLIKVGNVSYDVMDTFDSAMAFYFPCLPKLTYLDLSTHKNDETLPSVSLNLMGVLGRCCPNLLVLNLTNNNRVTDFGLRFLARSRQKIGCYFLEEIYVSECSLTDDAVLWLIQNFPYLQRVGYADMGSVLKRYSKRSVKRLHNCNKMKNELALRYMDNTESTSGLSDGSILSVASRLCPQMHTLRMRIKDEDADELHKVPQLSNLELRFYTGAYHEIGGRTLAFFQEHGHRLTSLTILCNNLISNHVMAIAKGCPNLKQLYLICNTFDIDDAFPKDVMNTPLFELEVLSVRVGLQQMTESKEAASLSSFLMEAAPHLQKLFLLFNCDDANLEFFSTLFSKAQWLRLHTLVYDSPCRSLIYKIPMDVGGVMMLASKLPALTLLGNLVSWNVKESEIKELRKMIKECNYDLNIVCSSDRHLNMKYF